MAYMCRLCGEEIHANATINLRMNGIKFYDFNVNKDGKVALNNGEIYIDDMPVDKSDIEVENVCEYLCLLCGVSSEHCAEDIADWVDDDRKLNVLPTVHDRCCVEKKKKINLKK